MPTTLKNLWVEAWQIMKKNCIPLEPYQEDIVRSLPEPDVPDGFSLSSMGYFLTEHFEGMKKHAKSLYDSYEMPKEIAEIILKHKVKMMTLWGWPEWGFSDIKHLKEETNQ